MTPVPKKDKIAMIYNAIKENTKEWEDEVFTKEEKLSAKGKKLSKILDALTLSNADKDRMAELVSEVSGETVQLEKEGDLEFKPLTAIVLTKVTDKHKHTYVTDTVLISLGDGTAIDENGKVGSHIPPSRQIVRCATDEEITKIPDVQIKGLMKEASIVIVG